MTVLVGYLSGKCGHAPLNLALEAAKSLGTSLSVAAVVPQPWMTPSPARVDAEFAAYADQLGSESGQEARQYLQAQAPEIAVDCLQVASRTAGDGLMDAVTQTGAEVLVVGSSSDGAFGQVVLGSTTDWLLHASPIPVAVSPRGYRGSRAGVVQRITCAYSGTQESVRMVERVVALTDRLRVPLRVVSYAIRGRTMFPPEVGLHTEDTVLDAWAEQLHEMMATLRTDGIVSDATELQVIAGNGWDRALDSTEWNDGDLLALGTTSRRSIKGVFLGAHGAKIIRHSPVPVLVLPN